MNSDLKNFKNFKNLQKLKIWRTLGLDLASQALAPLAQGPPKFLIFLIF